MKRTLWGIAKGLQFVGLIVVLVGVFISISEGLQDEGLSSMVTEFQGLAWGGGAFLVGWLLEAKIGAR